MILTMIPLNQSVYICYLTQYLVSTSPLFLRSVPQNQNIYIIREGCISAFLQQKEVSKPACNVIIQQLTSWLYDIPYLFQMNTANVSWGYNYYISYTPLLKEFEFRHSYSRRRTVIFLSVAEFSFTLTVIGHLQLVLSITFSFLQCYS